MEDLPEFCKQCEHPAANHGSEGCQAFINSESRCGCDVSVAEIWGAALTGMTVAYNSLAARLTQIEDILDGPNDEDVDMSLPARIDRLEQALDDLARSVRLRPRGLH